MPPGSGMGPGLGPGGGPGRGGNSLDPGASGQMDFNQLAMQIRNLLPPELRPFRVLLRQNRRLRIIRRILNGNLPSGILFPSFHPLHEPLPPNAGPAVSGFFSAFNE
jgi:hypothetical protein